MTQEELAQRTEEIAQNTVGPNKQIVHALAYQIRSNARLEKSQDDFAKSTSRTERIMIFLAVAQSILALVSIVIAVALK